MARLRTVRSQIHGERSANAAPPHAHRADLCASNPTLSAPHSHAAVGLVGVARLMRLQLQSPSAALCSANRAGPQRSVRSPSALFGALCTLRSALCTRALT